MKSNRSIFILCFMLSSLTAFSAEKCEVSSLDFFPATLEDKGDMHFLTKDSLNVKASEFNFDDQKKEAELSLHKKHHRQFANWTKDQINQRIALVHDGKSIHNPVIKAAIQNGKIKISFQDSKDYLKFKSSISQFCK